MLPIIPAVIIIPADNLEASFTLWKEIAAVLVFLAGVIFILS